MKLNNLSPAALALTLAAGILATGGFFNPGTEPVPTDFVPSVAATLILFIALIRGKNISFPLPAYALLALCLLSLRNGAADIRDSASLATAAIAAAAAYRARADDSVRRVVLAASLLLLIIGLYQRFIAFPALLPHLTGEAYNRLLSGRVFSTFMLPGQYASYLATLLPIAIAAATVPTAGAVDRYRILARIAFVGIFVGLALTRSLTGVLAGAVGVIVLLGPSRRSFGILLALSLVGLVAFALRPEMHASLSFITLRIHTDAATLHGWFDAPLLGHGAGSFEQLYMPRYWRTGADETLHPHCWPLKIAFEHGAVGLALWCAAAFSLFAPIRDRSFRAAAAAFFVASLVDVGDHSVTLRALGLLFLGASLRNAAVDSLRSNDGSTAVT